MTTTISAEPQAAPQAAEPVKPAKLDLSALVSALDALEPQKRIGGGVGRPPAYSVEEVEQFYNARSRGISWAQINTVLPKPFKRSGTLAQSVHVAATRHGIDTQKTTRGPRKIKG